MPYLLISADGAEVTEWHNAHFFVLVSLVVLARTSGRISIWRKEEKRRSTCASSVRACFRVREEGRAYAHAGMKVDTHLQSRCVLAISCSAITLTLSVSGLKLPCWTITGRGAALQRGYHSRQISLSRTNAKSHAIALTRLIRPGLFTFGDREGVAYLPQGLWWACRSYGLPRARF